jgi:GNAT superfamily N-acetyltransferase
MNFSMSTKLLFSPFLQDAAKARGVRLQASSTDTAEDELALWASCVNWRVNPMPNRIVAVSLETLAVIGASYYDDGGFLSAVAVLPEFREQRVAKLLIAATLGDCVQRLQVTSSTLHVLGSDANTKLHTLYASVGYSGGHSECGGDYTMAAIPADIEARIMTATHTATADTSSCGGKAGVKNIVL